MSTRPFGPASRAGRVGRRRLRRVGRGRRWRVRGGRGGCVGRGGRGCVGRRGCRRRGRAVGGRPARGRGRLRGHPRGRARATVRTVAAARAPLPAIVVDRGTPAGHSADGHRGGADGGAVGRRRARVRASPQGGPGGVAGGRAVPANDTSCQVTSRPRVVRQRRRTAWVAMRTGLPRPLASAPSPVMPRPRMAARVPPSRIRDAATVSKTDAVATVAGAAAAGTPGESSGAIRVQPVAWAGAGAMRGVGPPPTAGARPGAATPTLNGAQLRHRSRPRFQQSGQTSSRQDAQRWKSRRSGLPYWSRSVPQFSQKAASVNGRASPLKWAGGRVVRDAPHASGRDRPAA